MPGAGWYAAENLDDIKEELGNRRYKLDIPLRDLELPGQLEVSVDLDDFKPDEFRVMYRFSIRW